MSEPDEASHFTYRKHSLHLLSTLLSQVWTLNKAGQLFFATQDRGLGIEYIVNIRSGVEISTVKVKE